jgi:hypothetical protein
MQEFLNTYTIHNRDLQKQPKEQITKAFAKTIAVINKALGKNAFRPKKEGKTSGRLLAPIFDAVMVGTARRLERGNIKALDQFVERYETLLRNETFKVAISKSTTNEDRVRARIEEATRAFQDL